MTEFFRLTAAGVAFCARLGASDFDSCGFQIERHFLTPCVNECPYDDGANVVGTPEWDQIKKRFRNCVIWGEFDRLDGTIGYAHFCWNEALS